MNNIQKLKKNEVLYNIAAGGDGTLVLLLQDAIEAGEKMLAEA